MVSLLLLHFRIHFSRSERQPTTYLPSIITTYNIVAERGKTSVISYRKQYYNTSPGPAGPTKNEKRYLPFRYVVGRRIRIMGGLLNFELST